MPQAGYLKLAGTPGPKVDSLGVGGKQCDTGQEGDGQSRWEAESKLARLGVYLCL